MSWSAAVAQVVYPCQPTVVRVVVVRVALSVVPRLYCHLLTLFRSGGAECQTPRIEIPELRRPQTAQRLAHSDFQQAAVAAVVKQIMSITPLTPGPRVALAHRVVALETLAVRQALQRKGLPAVTGGVTGRREEEAVLAVGQEV
jgi:hypothetical protein